MSSRRLRADPWRGAIARLRPRTPRIRQPRPQLRAAGCSRLTGGAEVCIRLPSQYAGLDSALPDIPLSVVNTKGRGRAFCRRLPYVHEVRALLNTDASITSPAHHPAARLPSRMPWSRTSIVPLSHILSAPLDLDLAQPSANSDWNDGLRLRWPNRAFHNAKPRAPNAAGKPLRRSRHAVLGETSLPFATAECATCAAWVRVLQHRPAAIPIIA